MGEESINKIKELEDYIKRIQKQSFKEKALLCQVFEEKFGSEVAEIVASQVIANHKITWAKIAAKEGENDIAALIRTLWEPMKKTFEFTVEVKSEGTQIHCTRCPLADMARELNLEKWGFQFYCMSDFGIVEGFNPKIGFKRTKTLMQGDDCCDHFYYLEK